MVFFFLIFNWWTDVVDSGTYRFTSIEVKPGGYSEITYSNYSGSFLHYANYDGSNWHRYLVDSVPGGVAQLKRRGDYIYVAYNDGTCLRYARSQDGLSWIREITNFRPDPYDGIELGMDSVGPKIVYHNYTGNIIFYVYKEGNVWLQDTVHRYSPGDAAGFSLDNTGIPHISFYSSSSPYGFTYATKQGNIWIKELVSGPGLRGQISSVAINDSNRVFLLYWRDAPTPRVFFAEKISANWISEIVSDSAYAGTEGLDIYNNRAFCTFFRRIPSGRMILCFAERMQPTQWRIEVVDTADYFLYAPSLAMDLNGIPHISYVDAEGRVKYATKSDVGITEKKVGFERLISGNFILDITGRKISNEQVRPGVYFVVNANKIRKIVVLRLVARKKVETDFSRRSIF